MTVAAHWTAKALMKALNQEVNWLNDTINVMLLTSSFTPDQNKDDYLTFPAWAASTAYTVGQVIVPPTRTGHVYKCTTAGTSGASAPTFPTTAGGTVTDGGVTWTEDGLRDISYYEVSGTGYTAGGATLASKTISEASLKITMSAANVTWSSSTITAAYAIIYDNTPTTGLTTGKTVLGWVDFGGSQSSSNGNFTITWDSTNGIFSITAS